MAQQVYRDVNIRNAGRKKCLIMVASQKSVMTSSAYSQAEEAASSSSQSTSGKFSYGVASAEASYSKSNSKSSKKSSSGSWRKAYSAFLDEGYVQVNPGTAKNFAVQGVLCYISVAVLEGECFISNWPQRGSEFVFKDNDLLEVPSKKSKKKKKVEKVEMVGSRFRINTDHGYLKIETDKNGYVYPAAKYGTVFEAKNDGKGTYLVVVGGGYDGYYLSSDYDKGMYITGKWDHTAYWHIANGGAMICQNFKSAGQPVAFLSNKYPFYCYSGNKKEYKKCKVNLEFQ